MIGHYLYQQNQDAEDRLLTNALTPGALYRAGGRRCLVGVVEDWAEARVLRSDDPRLNVIRPRLVQWDSMEVALSDSPNARHQRANRSVFHRFDALCERFGIERTTAAIRNRILSNQARRTLTQVPEYAMALR